MVEECRRKTLYQQLRQHLGEVLRKLAAQKESRIEEGHLLPDHVHMMISIPPKYAVSQVIGYIKGKSAIHLARVYGERKRNFVGQHFWARGYFVSTIGRDEGGRSRIHPQSGAGGSAIRPNEPVALIGHLSGDAKDQITTGEVPTTMASIIQPDFGEGMTATAVTKLREAGAILLGKNNMHEFGKGSSVSFHFGEPKNPWNLAYEPSHSSTGSGISVAAGLVSASLGEDTGGSIRGPAWANGVVGIRPTFGRVSRYRGIMYAWTQDTIGPLTRTVADNALVLQTIAGHDPKDPLSSIRPVPHYAKHFTAGLEGVKLGLVREMSVGQTLHPDVAKMLEKALDVLKSLGAMIEEVSLPKAKYAVPLQFLTADADVAAVFVRKWLRKHWDKFDVGTRTRIAAAALIPATVYARAMRGRALVRNEILAAF